MHEISIIRKLCSRKYSSSQIAFDRHEFYQKPEEVVVTIFAKNIPAENVSIDYGEQIVSLIP